MNIFDLISSQELTAYWEELTQDEAPYPCEELFPNDKKRGLSLKWIKGSRGLPIVLKTSAFDAAAIPRPRIGFDKLTAEMPYFKESTYIDEELRQELNMVAETGNQAYIDSVMNRVFDDETSLLRGAAASRERMRMMALTTGVVTMTANGQQFTFDYGIPAEHKTEVKTSWSDHTNSDPIEDIRVAMEKIQDDTGVTITRAMCDGATWRHIRNNEDIKKSIFVLSNGQGTVSDQRLRDYIMEELGIEVMVNDKRYKDEAGTTTKYMPENTFVLFPDGELGRTWFGTTPAESDLMGGSVANVSITDTGVAVTTAQKVDPVQVETIVSMICLPSFEQADQVYIIDTVKNLTNLTVKPATGNVLGKDLTTLGTYTVDESGIISGSLTKQTGWTEFDGSNEDHQKGYFVAINCNPWAGRKFRQDRTTGKGNEVAFSGDGIAIVWLGNNVETAKTAKSIVVIDSDGSEQVLRYNLQFKE